MDCRKLHRCKKNRLPASHSTTRRDGTKSDLTRWPDQLRILCSCFLLTKLIFPTWPKQGKDGKRSTDMDPLSTLLLLILHHVYVYTKDQKEGWGALSNQYLSPLVPIHISFWVGLFFFFADLKSSLRGGCCAGAKVGWCCGKSGTMVRGPRKQTSTELGLGRNSGTLNRQGEERPGCVSLDFGPYIRSKS